MLKTSFLIVIGCLIISCTRQVDFSNPKSVVEEYYSLMPQNKHKLEYNLIADTCKEYATLQDYIEYKSSIDSLLNELDLNIKKINQLTINPSYPKYRRFEIQLEIVEKSRNDTIIDYAYSTVYNEKGQWKLIWAENIFEAANKLMNSQKFSEAIKAYYQVLRYDPLNGSAYNNIGWCQYRQNNYKEALISANKALELTPKDESNYNLLAGIYSSQNNIELAIENYKKAINMCYSVEQKVYLLSNISIDYLAIEKHKEALESVNQALLIDSTHTHAWWRKGNIFLSEKKLDSAIICFQKATKFEPMDDFLQKQLYFDLANTEYTKANLQSVNFNERTNLLINSKEHILKALGFQHDDTEYKQLLNQINNAKK